jgi:hypothetical protein
VSDLLSWDKEMTTIINCIVLLFLTLMLQLNCGQPDMPEKKFGPDQVTDLVVMFEKTATNTEINEFEEKVIGKPHESGVGFRSLDGIANGYRFKSAEFEFEGINFKDDAAVGQRAYVKQRILGSKIVQKVFENTSPNQIRIEPED